MKQKIIENNLYIFSLFAAILCVIFFINRSSYNILQQINIILFILITLHVWEEGKVPGGFADLATQHLGVPPNSAHAGEIGSECLITAMIALAVLFPEISWLSLPIIILGVLELIVHSLAIKIFKRSKPYIPGHITALIMFPIAIYGFYIIGSEHLMSISQICLGILLLIITFAFTQFICLKIKGQNYREFIKQVRNKLFSNK